jgi:hypothetical protein
MLNTRGWIRERLHPIMLSEIDSYAQQDDGWHGHHSVYRDLVDTVTNATGRFTPVRLSPVASKFGGGFC